MQACAGRHCWCDFLSALELLVLILVLKLCSMDRERPHRTTGGVSIRNNAQNIGVRFVSLDIEDLNLNFYILF